MGISNRVIARNIKKARKACGITQEKASELLGLSLQHYGRFERGERPVSLAHLARMAEVLNVSVVSLLAGSTDRLFDAAAPRQSDPGPLIGFLSAGCSDESKALMLDICRLIASRDK